MWFDYSLLLKYFSVEGTQKIFKEGNFTNLYEKDKSSYGITDIQEYAED